MPRGFTLLFLAAALLAPGPARAQVSVGHRGGHALPENTLPTYDYSLNAGTDVLEIDVWLSKDGVPVCIHDATVDRTTDGTGPVTSFTLAQLKALDAGSWLDPIYTGVRIPTLAEALQLIKGRGRVLLDIKNKGFIPAIVQVIDAVGFPREDVSAWIRFFAASDVSDPLPEAGILVAAGSPGFDEERYYDNAVEGHLGLIQEWDRVDAEYIDLAHYYGLLAFSNGMLYADYATAIATGLDGLIVSRPDLLAPLLPGPPRACADGIDNDGDSLIDYPDDPGCFAAFSPVEDPACDDGVDNNGDGWIDYPADPGCFSPVARREGTKCQNGIDDDQDGAIDYPDDPGCADASDDSEEPDCKDGLDNDDDGKTDWPQDLACSGPDGTDEREACRNGIDDDGDGLVDYPDDPQCDSPDHLSEYLACMDGLDNDHDGDIDFPDDAGCNSPEDGSEIPDCMDGLDNDHDGDIDFPDDLGCGGPEDRLETDDNDGDGIPDRADNCYDAGNPDQCDTDQDGFGNRCDSDFNEDNTVGIPDFGIFSNCFGNLGSPEQQAACDCDCDGVVGIPDFGCFSIQFGQSAPGPSGLTCAGSSPCPP